MPGSVPSPAPAGNLYRLQPELKQSVAAGRSLFQFPTQAIYISRRQYNPLRRNRANCCSRTETCQSEVRDRILGLPGMQGRDTKIIPTRSASHLLYCPRVNVTRFGADGIEARRASERSGSTTRFARRASIISTREHHMKPILPKISAITGAFGWLPQILKLSQNRFRASPFVRAVGPGGHCGRSRRDRVLSGHAHRRTLRIGRRRGL